MPLNKLENFLKNVDGRILYVSPSDIDATDSITNEGNSLTKPFKTIQRALLESARFSYVKGNDNDLIERTTILLMPGQHEIDNRPGFGIKNESGIAKAIESGPNGAVLPNANIFNLTNDSTFDLSQENNILYKFNSVHGGVIVPRGTSIVGLDLRKTRIRPKYVPNPTTSYDKDPKSAIFRITGTCYFWQFSVFDGDENKLVYTDNGNFGSAFTVKPVFSHHKLTIFEYADGVNLFDRSGLTDLDMYYAKLSNAYNAASNRDIDQKFPSNSDGFAKQRPEWEIVGAFADDPISIETIVSGDIPGVPSNKVTVTTTTPHGLSVGTPIKIKGVSPQAYNISTKVSFVDPLNNKKFNYALPNFDLELQTPGDASGNPGGTVVIETDTVTGASPYIFNISMRSVYGMNGLHADGSKASGFRSMVVAQFTGVSLQKDDRAFVKYIPSNRDYEGNDANPVFGDNLALESSSTNPETAYHLDSGAIYRSGWETCHIKISKDAILQIVSVFAIGYNKHFEALSGGDASITNSNSNFGQLALISDGFKKNSFASDNTSFLTHIIPPKSIDDKVDNIDWLSIDVGLTTTTSTGGGNNSNKDRLYLFGFDDIGNTPPALTQGFKIGAKFIDPLFVEIEETIYSSNILMSDGTTSSEKNITLTTPSDNIFNVPTGHKFETGEKILFFSDVGDLPENIKGEVIYYVIKIDAVNFKVAASLQNALNNSELDVIGGQNLRAKSRVVDKISGEVGHPVQFDSDNSNWYVTTSDNNEIFQQIESRGVAGIGDRTKISFVKRISDTRSIDDKVYKLRVTIPKELTNSKNPESSFILQESTTTGIRTDIDLTIKSSDTELTREDFFFDRNPRFISSCTFDGSSIVSITAERPHNLNKGDLITIKNATDTTNSVGAANSGFNGTFTVENIPDSLSFTYNPGRIIPVSVTNSFDKSSATSSPRFERTDLKSNIYTYRNIKISDHIPNQQDGIYHLIPSNASYSVTTSSGEFSDLKYGQNVVDLYPQLDRDNSDDNPLSSKSFALRNPLGDVTTNDLKKSITRETNDLITKKLGIGLTITNISTLSGGISTVTFAQNHDLSGISTGKLNSVTAGFNDGTFHNVKILTNTGIADDSNWNGGLASVIISGGSIVSVDITNSGSGYQSGSVAYIDAAIIGSGGGNDQRRIKDKFDQGNVGLGVSLLSGLTSNLTFQFTGSGITTDSHVRLHSVPSRNTIAIARTTGDNEITTDQYALIVSPSVQSTAVTSNSLTTFTSTNPHGLVVGNRFQYNDNSNNNIGTFIVKSRISTTVFTAITDLDNGTLSNGFVLKHGYSANNSTSDIDAENLSVRGIPISGNEFGKLAESATVSSSTIRITLLNDKSGILNRFSYGSYLLIDDEIMRVSKNSLSGSEDDKVTVIRGVLGTSAAVHDNGSLIQKIKPLPIEFHRPSILRASGHTFEYLGYGPGNYSTALPQVQIKTLTEKEEFLSQSQERSAGAVVYTGMNDKGDFYIGNNKKSATTGEEINFDVPIPTITGADASRLSVIFDEVTVKERILVEGGKSNTSLSRFDGPVTFNEKINILNNVKIQPSDNQKDSTDVTTGALVIDGGVGIAGTVNVGSGSSIKFTDNSKVLFGNSNDLQVYHSGTNSVIADAGVGQLKLLTSSFRVNNADDNANLIAAEQSGSVSLFFNDTKRLETSDSGVTVTESLTATNVSATNVSASSSVTAINFFGDGSTLDGINSDRLVDSENTVRILASTDGINITGSTTVTGNILPNSDSSIDIGTNTVRFANGYFDSLYGDASNLSGIDELFDSDSTSRAQATTSGLNISGLATVTDTIIGKKGIDLNGDTVDSGDIHSAGGNDGIAVLQMTTNLGQWRIASKKSDGADQTIATFKLDGDGQPEAAFDGDVVAFASDDRLKTNRLNIVNALDKVKSLNGFTFNFNETGASLGFDTKVSHAGVSAQDVQKILPEIIKPAPSNNEFLTVQYEKLTPLLIEAIKELSAKVDALEKQINN